MRPRLLARRAIVLLTLAAPIARASSLATASGRFRSDRTSFDVRGAYAFWHESASPFPGRVLRVAVASVPLDGADLDRYYDRLRAIDRRAANGETRIVFFEFTPEGEYHGLSYYFGPGDGCGYCYDGQVDSTVRFADGRARGRVAFEEKGRSFRIELDVAIPEKTWGTPLAADGGEAGRTYRAYQAALEKRDLSAVRAALDSRSKARWARPEGDELDRTFEDAWTNAHLEMTDVRIDGGFENGDRAVLLVRGRSPYGAVRGEALFRREGGTWRFSEDLLGLD